MRHGRNDRTVGPAVSLFVAIRDKSVQLRFDNPDDAACEQARHCLAKAEPPVFPLSGGFAVRCMRAAIDVPNNSGSLAIFAAIPRASSLVSGLAAVAWRDWPLLDATKFCQGTESVKRAFSS